MQNTESGEHKATRQCWECLKRRLVCDHTLPGCKKCQKAGKDCPGYGEQKPLQWIQPGKVTSRRRKKDCSPKIYTVPVRETLKCRTFESELNAVPESIREPPTSESFFSQSQAWSVFQPFKSSKVEEWEYLSEPYKEKVRREAAYREASDRAMLDQMFALGGTDKIQYIVRNGLEDEAKAMLKLEPHPLKKLERLLHFIRSHDVPSYDYLSNETSDIVQAVNYCESSHWSIQALVQSNGRQS